LSVIPFLIESKEEEEEVFLRELSVNPSIDERREKNKIPRSAKAIP
jgi:hypothetical protein